MKVILSLVFVLSCFSISNVIASDKYQFNVKKESSEAKSELGNSKVLNKTVQKDSEAKIKSQPKLTESKNPNWDPFDRTKKGASDPNWDPTEKANQVQSIQ